jgi:ferritin-like metal-binding protein YciE
MEISNFKDMYLAELQELRSVEDQLADALLRMAAAASHPALKRYCFIISLKQRSKRNDW